MPSNVDKVTDIISELKNEFLQKYGCTIFEIDAAELTEKNEIVLTGECLTNRQISLLKRKIRPVTASNKVSFNVNIISDIDSSFKTKLWGSAKDDIVNVTSDFGGEKLSTQITPKNNYFKIVINNADRSLILLDDQTLGWVGNDEIDLFDRDCSPYWQNIRRAKRDAPFEVDSLFPMFDEALKYVNKVKYLLGGKSIKGIDCSALTQTVFKSAFQIVLPRHALDQMKCGLRIAKSDIISGDLVFARLKKRNIMHVGIAYDGAKKIIHSCLREQSVICEDFEKFFDHYTFTGAKRIVTERCKKETCRKETCK